MLVEWGEEFSGMLAKQAEGAGMSLPGYGPQRGVYEGMAVSWDVAWDSGVPGLESTFLEKLLCHLVSPWLPSVSPSHSRTIP